MENEESSIICCPSKDVWAIRITNKGIFFNKEIFPESGPDDFANFFIRILEKQYDVKFTKKINYNIDRPTNMCEQDKNNI